MRSRVRIHLQVTSSIENMYISGLGHPPSPRPTTKNPTSPPFQLHLAFSPIQCLSLSCPTKLVKPNPFLKTMQGAESIICQWLPQGTQPYQPNLDENLDVCCNASKNHFNVLIEYMQRTKNRFTKNLSRQWN